VVLADLTARAEEVAISSKHLTLIHFEMGDVSMVAIGDPTIVNVTVKGPDVLLRASASSGTTNAFIWQASRYTQWVLVVRPDSKDARLIIVKDAGVGGGEGFLRTPSDRTDPNGAKTGEAQTGAPPADWSAVAVSPVRGTGTPELPRQPSPAKASAESGTPRVTSDACEKTVLLDQFVKTLNVRQRELFVTFLTDGTLARFQALLLELNPLQRCGLLALLSASGSSAPVAPVAGMLPSGIALSRSDKTAIANPADQSVLSQVAMSIAPRVIDGQLFFYYTLENHSPATLLTDVLRLRILDRDGHRLAFGINRASPSGHLGRLQTNDVEYGVIALGSPESGLVPENGLVLEWKLRTFGSAAQHQLRLELPAPSGHAP
jgi:hypothetical protein